MDAFSNTCRECLKSFDSIQACLAHEMVAHVKLTEQPKTRKRRRPIKLRITESDEYKLLREKASDEVVKCKSGQEYDTLSKVYQPSSEYLFDVYEMIVEDLEKDLTNIGGGRCKILPFGSAITGLSFKDSDIDFYIEQPKKSGTKKQFGRVYNAIQDSTNFSDKFAIWQARVPIIKCIHKKTGYQLDINTSSGHGVYNSEFLEKLIKSDPRFQPSILIIRIWAKYREINKTGGLNSYCLTLMFFFYMQHLEIIPSFKTIQAWAEPVIFDDINFGLDTKVLGHSKDDRSVRDLVEGFFNYYHNFDFANRIICPHLGHAITWEFIRSENNFPQYHEQIAVFKKKMSDNDNEGEKPKLRLSIMVVQDPFCLFQNTAKSVSDALLEKFQKHIQLTNSLIQQCKSISNQWWLIRILFEVFDPNKEKIEGVKGKPEKKAGNIPNSASGSNSNSKKGKQNNPKPPEPETKNSQKNSSKRTFTLSPMEQELFYIRSYLRKEFPNKVFTLPEIQKFWSEKIVEYLKLMLTDIFALDVVVISTKPKMSKSESQKDVHSDKLSFKAKISANLDIWSGRNRSQTKKTSSGNFLKEEIDASKNLKEGRKKDTTKKVTLSATFELQVAPNNSIDVILSDDTGSNSKSLFEYFVAHVRILLKGYLEINLIKGGKF